MKTAKGNEFTIVNDPSVKNNLLCSLELRDEECRGRRSRKIQSGRIGSSATFRDCGLKIGQEIVVDNPRAGGRALKTEIRKAMSGYSCG